MTEYICTYCGSVLANKRNLRYHQKRTKFCLEKQKEMNLEVVEDLKDCEFCHCRFEPCSYKKHMVTCKAKQAYELKLQEETNQSRQQAEIQFYVEQLNEYKEKVRGLEIENATLRVRLDIALDKTKL